MKYSIYRSIFDNDLAVITADSKIEAANKFARKIAGKKATARLVHPAGYYCAYIPVLQHLGGGLNRYGDSFIVIEYCHRPTMKWGQL